MKRYMQVEKGQELVEYALVLPLFLLLTIGTIEFSILFFQYSTVSNAAREAARAGIVMPSAACDEACIDARVLTAALRLTAGLDLDQLEIEITHPTADQVQVEMSYSTGYITRMMVQAVGGDDSVNLRTTATMRRE